MIVWRDSRGYPLPEDMEKDEEGVPIFLGTGRKGTEIKTREDGVIELVGMDRITQLLRASHWLCEAQTKMCYRAVILRHYLEDGSQEVTTHEQKFERGRDKGNLNEPERADYYWGHYFNTKEVTEDVKKDFNSRVGRLFKCYMYGKTE